MIKFPGQFHNYRKTTIGDNIVTFSIDRMYSKDVVELIEKDIGTEFVVYLEPADGDTNYNEDPEQLIDKFRKQLHAMLSKCAKEKETDQETEKSKLRDILKERELIEESTKELNLKGYAIAVNIVDDWLDEKY